MDISKNQYRSTGGKLPSLNRLLVTKYLENHAREMDLKG